MVILVISAATSRVPLVEFDILTVRGRLCVAQIKVWFCLKCYAVFRTTT